MTKPLPTSCIKKQKSILDWHNFNLEKLNWKITPQDKIGHLFIIDIKFGPKKDGEKKFLFNKINLPIFEKKLTIKLIWMFCFSALRNNEKKRQSLTKFM